MSKNKLFLIVLGVVFLIQKESFSQPFTGFYAIYESNVTTNLVLNQYVKSNDFRESYNAELASYPVIKLGISQSMFSGEEMKTFGIDYGVGISYAKSKLNAIDELNPQYSANYFGSTQSNNETFFNYYQTGNIAKVSDFGINAHIDMGTVIYIGGEIDAGISRLNFTDSKVSTQSVKSTGWFAIPRVQLGLSFPFPIFNMESDNLFNLKIYASYGWNFRTNSMNWKSDDKKLNNFSRINSSGNPIGIGFSLTYAMRNL
jgi:hypothetical protein